MSNQNSNDPLLDVARRVTRQGSTFSLIIGIGLIILFGVVFLVVLGS